jgi:NAD(P)-dependent dehydrogenase (short-subunit alcohol dehydrogenase family)
MNTLSDLIDATLEISVVGSFSRIGPAIRRRVYGWSAPNAHSLAGRTALVTGPTSGLGSATASALAAAGARVVLLGRDEDRLRELNRDLSAKHGEDRFPIVVVDMGSLTSVRAGVGQILATEERLDVVVDNAGAMFQERVEGPDGIEASVALMVAGPFVLIGGLLPLLQRTEGSRVIAVTSGGMYTQALDLDDLESRDEPFSGPRAYARAKRAQVTLMREWSRRLAPAGVSFSAMHPGWADTPGLAESLPRFHRIMGPLLRTPAEGIDTIAWLATAPTPRSRSGQLFLDRRPRPFDRIPTTRLGAADRRRLWDIVVAMTGGSDPAPSA